MCGGEAEDYGDGTSDAATFRDYVDGVCKVLDAAINPRAIDEKGMLQSNLNIAMADMMRTSTFCLLSGGRTSSWGVDPLSKSGLCPLPEADWTTSGPQCPEIVRKSSA